MTRREHAYTGAVILTAWLLRTIHGHACLMWERVCIRSCDVAGSHPRV